MSPANLMGHDDMTAKTVGQMAQSTTKLQLDAITVIGLFTGPQGDTALIRTGKGEIHKIAAGDRVAGLTILTITDRQVQLRDHRGRTYELTLPDAA